jgi:hypothetical protein
MGIKASVIRPLPLPFFSPTATWPGRMSSSNYEPLPQEGEGSRDILFDERALTHSGPVRPPTYYGEGPFDPPSSEDEDESLLQKENNRSLGMVESAGYAEPEAKVRRHHSATG